VSARADEATRSRLLLADAGARRVAILDLARRADPGALAALAEHLPRERDERGLFLIIEALRAARHAPAAGVLRGLYEDSAAPGGPAVMAARAADEIAPGATG
jgi:hypothetical protein